MTKSGCGGVRSSKLDSLGMRYNKTRKHKNFIEKSVLLKKSDNIFQKHWKFSKSHFFSKNTLLLKTDFFEKSDFLKIFDFWKRSSFCFFNKKKTPQKNRAIGRRHPWKVSTAELRDFPTGCYVVSFTLIRLTDRPTAFRRGIVWCPSNLAPCLLVSAKLGTCPP